MSTPKECSNEKKNALESFRRKLLKFNNFFSHFRHNCPVNLLLIVYFKQNNLKTIGTRGLRHAALNILRLLRLAQEEYK
jgi:hypothetical protein